MVIEIGDNLALLLIIIAAVTAITLMAYFNKRYED